MNQKQNPNPDRPPIRYVPPQKRQPSIGVWLILGIILALVILIVCLLLPKKQAVPTGTDDTTAASSVTEPAQDETTADTGPYPGYTEFTPDKDAVSRGDLILVNAAHAYVFPEEPDRSLIADHRTGDYKLAEYGLELDRTVLEVFNRMLADFSSARDKKDTIINSAFRSREDQEAIYQSRLEAYGQAYADAYVAKPGFSEHHTGLAMDLAIYTDDGISRTFDQDEAYDWFYYASHSYGFVLRYAEEKSAITGISGEAWHFRYVGKPHAYYMYENNLCLEEYIDLLRNYPFDGEHLRFRDDEEQEWEIYFLPTDHNTIGYYLPAGRPYSISGNNVDGLIVTAEVPRVTA